METTFIHIFIFFQKEASNCSSDVSKAFNSVTVCFYFSRSRSFSWSSIPYWLASTNTSSASSSFIYIERLGIVCMRSVKFVLLNYVSGWNIYPLFHWNWKKWMWMHPSYVSFQQQRGENPTGFFSRRLPGRVSWSFSFLPSLFHDIFWQYFNLVIFNNNTGIA